MYEVIDEMMFEFAMKIQSLIRKGWELVTIEYGERRLDIGPHLVIKRNEEIKKIYSPSEVDRILEKDHHVLL